MRLFSEAIITMAKQKSEKSEWAQTGWQSVQQRIAAWQNQSTSIPTEAGGWIHNYVCPDHWHPLTYDGASPDEHICPAGHTLVGEKYDAAWRVWRHRQIADLAREAGLAHVVLGLGSSTGSEGSSTGSKYAETAVSILTQYADFYTQLDGQADAEAWMLTGHAFNQALTEALWAVPLIHAYDLVVDTLTPAVNERLIRDLWQPLTAVMTSAQDKLIAQNNIKSNYMAWLNVTIGCLGFTLNEQSLIDRAIQSPAGFIPHLEQSICADGFEYEATPYYHNFVLLANLILAEAAHANGIDLYAVRGSQGQNLKHMGCALAKLAWPDGSIPDLGDGSYWQHSIFDPEINQAYEILHAKQPEDLFAWTLQKAYERQGAARDNWAALMYGASTSSATASADSTTASTSSATTSADSATTSTGSVTAVPSTKFAPALPSHTFLKESGVAILRSEKKLAAMLPFGPYRGSHHHYDRLSLTVWPFSKEAGSPLYGLSARKAWYPHSYAHNTMVVDGQSHANCGAELLNWNGRCLTTSAPDAYPNVQLTRTTEMQGDILRDEVTVQSHQTHTFDWVFHIDGDIELPADTQPLSEPLATEGAGTYIQLIAQKQIEASVSFDINFYSDLYRLALHGERPFTLLIGKAPGTSRYPQRQRTVLIGRTVSTEQRYQTTIIQQ